MVPGECLLELKTESRPRGVHNLLTHASCHLDVVIRCEDFNTLKRLLQVTAVVSRFIALLRSRVKGEEVMATISTADITNSELKWIKLSQALRSSMYSNPIFFVMRTACGDARQWRSWQ